jgi:hypothetical protein
MHGEDYRSNASSSASSRNKNPDHQAPRSAREPRGLNDCCDQRADELAGVSSPNAASTTTIPLWQTHIVVGEATSAVSAEYRTHRVLSQST